MTNRPTLLRALVAILLLLSSNAKADLLVHSFEGIRPVGMGNAFIALADDANLLFYNPAGLARVKGVHVNLIDVTLGVDSTDTLTRLGNAVFNGNYQNLIRNDLQYMRFNVHPSVITPYFGMSVFSNIQSYTDVANVNALLAKNIDITQLPALLAAHAEIQSFSDIGVIAGLGIPLSDYFSLGFTVRGIQRSSVNVDLSVQNLLSQFNILDPQSFLTDIYAQLKKSPGIGWGIGLNVGALARVPINGAKGAKFQLAATIEDLGQTTFRPLGNSLVTPPPIRPSYNIGSALIYPISRDSQFNVALDLRDNFQPIAFVKTFHFGAEFRHKIFGIRGGIHQGYPTYGFSIETPPHTRLHFASYGVELGNGLYQKGQRWWMLQLEIGFNPL